MLKKTFGVLAVIVCVAVSARAATFIVPSDRDMVRRADAIVVGAALASYSHMIDGRVETVTSFSIHEVIKGSVGFSIDIHEPGGRVGDQITFIPGVPRFSPGEESILFLTRTHRDEWAVTEIALGRFVFVSDQAGQRLALRDEGEIHGWDPDGLPHREAHRVAARFLDFLRTEARGGVGRTDYFTKTRQLAIAPNSLMPRNNVTYSATSYTFDVGGGLGGRFNVFPAAVSLYTGGGTPASGITATNAAISAWDGDPNSNVKYQNAGSAACPNTGAGACKGLAGIDGVNTVLFERDLSAYGAGPFSCPGNGSYGGTLGIGGITSASGTHSGPNAETFDTIREVDVEMNVNVLGCAALGQGNINSAVTHEVGHTLGFRHSDQTRADDPAISCSTDPTLDCEFTTAIMRSSIAQGLNGVLQAYDQRAVRAVYPCSLGGGCQVLNNDFDNDGKPDLIWRNYVTGQNSIWYMNGTVMKSGASLAPVSDPNWSIEGTADIDGDGQPDLIWRNYRTGQNAVWYMNGTVAKAYGYFDSVPDINWRIEGVGDLDGDGHPDFLWRNYITGQNTIWRLNGTTTVGYNTLPSVPDINWRIQGLGDFDGNGTLDIVWRNYLTGQNTIWYLNGVTLGSYGTFPSVPDLNWHIAGTGDYNSDGHTDLVWRNYLTGQDTTWNMNNTTVLSYGYIDTVDIAWNLGGRGPVPR
jgi:hypothetical protein